MPKPAFEDHWSRIQDGNVWIAEVDGEAAGIVVLEEGQYFLTIYCVALAPEFQGRRLDDTLLAEDLACKKMLQKLRLYSYNFAKRRAPHPSRGGEMLINMVKPMERDPPPD